MFHRLHTTVMAALALVVTSHAVPQEGVQRSPEFMRAEAALAQSIARTQVDDLVAAHRRGLLDLYITLVEKDNQFANLALQDVLDGSVVLEPPVIQTAYARLDLARMARAVRASPDWSMHSIEVLAFCYRLDSMLAESIQDSKYQSPFLLDREAGIPVDIFGHIDWEAIRSSDDRAELEQLVEVVYANRQAYHDLKRAESIRSRFVESVGSVCRPLLERLSEADVPIVERIGAEIGASPAEFDAIREWYSMLRTD